MLTVRTTLGTSGIEGIGVFAAEPIKKGTSVWVFDPRFDLLIDPDDVEKMGPIQQEFLDRYAYHSTTSGKLVLCTDDARFTNHSSQRNNIDVVPFPGETETRGVANRDIASGEELLINYRDFDAFDEKSDAPYLNT